MDQYSHLQLREVFHIEFLRWLTRKVKPESYAVKGGVNLRFFFKSFRYSEDMDLDVSGIRVIELKDLVMKILSIPLFQDNLKPFGIMRVVAPDITKAKQTETTQRFKVHLILSSGEDLFTKIEFSRRDFAGKTIARNAIVETIDEAVLRVYKLAPLLVSHYDIYTAIAQKLHALSARTVVQARDIFDLYVLSSQYSVSDNMRLNGLKSDIFSKAHERIFEVGFEQFRDTVVSYLSVEDQALYNTPHSWDEVRLKVSHFVEEVCKNCA